MNALPYALYAEDNATTAQLFIKILAGHNPAYRVVHVSDGEDALDFLRCRGRFDGRDPRNPAVIFLDVEMLRMDGLEALREIKADAQFGTIPIVMLAGTLDPQKMQKSYELGANAHLVKPVDFRRFANFVRTLGDFWLTMNQAPALGSRRS
jgi:two-component system response regulator